MKKVFALIFLFCALSVWAQQPLLTTKWTQGAPYNRHCPTDPFDSLEAELHANLNNAGLQEILDARAAYYDSVK